MPSVHPAILKRAARLCQDLSQYVTGLGEVPHALLLLGVEADDLGRAFARIPAPAKALRTGERSSKEQRHRAHAAATALVRAEVWRRSNERCECCKLPLAPEQGALDHFKGGRGRRRPLTNTANCWRLCTSLERGDGAPGCHEQKTLNTPSRKWWEERFLLHLIDIHLSPPAWARAESTTS